MKILYSKNKNFDKTLDGLLLQRKNKIRSNSFSVINIIKDVKKNGDKALLKYEKRFNQNKIIIPNLNQISNSIKSLDKKVKDAIDLAYKRIYKFHSFQKFKNISYTDKLKNKLEYKYIPIDSVAIYVPGSTASYPSSVLMSAIPAIVAGVKRIIMINPGINGKQNSAVLYAARKCKIKEIYSIGGPSAIAAAAYGTKKIKKVNKIVGPGNSYVTAAKKEVFGDVGIEGMTAGPSEVTIVCDKFSNPEWVASDLIAQAEHDNLAQCILISKNKHLIEKVKVEIINQLKKIPRGSVANKSLLSNGILIQISSDKKIIEIVNKIAPEHLELNVKNYKRFIPKINNAGSICLGKYAVMAMTDYNVGSNHVLPTNGSAKYSSGISVNEFYKRISYINLSKKGIESLGPSVITLANYEGLAGHAQSIKKRIRRNKFVKTRLT
ncbi:histidinol dehydrogenase [Pelagibacterales bacterium SAG-MED01]|nr:histidinol dehydrogenase [Pelagibacterales bacterium SAG-MED01]